MAGPRSNVQRRRTTAPPAPRRTQPRPPHGSAGLTIDRGALTQVFIIPGFAILPLRLFLGITFLYAGIQKMTDPGFFRLGSSTYIGSQLRAFSNGSPIHFLMVHFLEHAVAIGLLTIFTELLIGALVFLGLFTRIAALIGLVLNLIFFLSASWHTYPYFYGSDIVFVMCWLTLAIAGPGAYCLDAAILTPLRQEIGPAQRLILGPLEQAKPEYTVDAVEPVTSRRAGVFSRAEVLVAGIGTVILLVLGLVPRGAPSASTASSPITSGGSSSSGSNSNGGSSSSSSAAAGQKVGNTSQIPVNSAISATDPKSGDPALVIHAADSKFYAYDAVCTHAGCTVEYDPSYKLIVCPCHGGAFDPTHGAQVVAGPPPAPLAELPIKIDAKGNIFLS